MFRVVALLAFALVLVGCAVRVKPQATGGSRSDGTITMSYQYRTFQFPRVDEAAMDARASVRCRGWGYAGAEAFGGKVIKEEDGVKTVTIEYQCLVPVDRY